MLLVTGDRGLAGAFNSQIIRAGNRRARELEAEGKEVVWYASGRRGVSSLHFRGCDVAGAYTGFTDRPAFANARDDRATTSSPPTSTASSTASRSSTTTTSRR